MGGRAMKLHISALALCALVFAPAASLAQESNPGNAPPPKAGTMRVTTKAPEPEKWNVQATANGSQRVFKCKPLACSDPQTVSFTFQKSPTTLKPNPQALEKFAKEDLPKSIRAASASREILSDGAEKIETLASDTATLKGYPSVLNESKFSKGASATYMQTAIIFAGPMMIRVQSSSPDGALAKKALAEFIEIMQIEEGPPAPPAPPKPRPGMPRTEGI
jgi:hypothetical protein